MAKFEIYKDNAAQFRWRLKSNNGQIIATAGESYVHKAGAEKGVAAIKRDAPVAMVDDVS